MPVATGIIVQSLKEMRDSLATVHAGSIYHHFWGALMRHRFDEPEYNNDFARWVDEELRDETLAERLAVIDPTDFGDLESLRQHLIDVIEERLDEVQRSAWVPAHKAFHFVRSQIVVFDTRRRITIPEELVPVVPTISETSVFYHFIDARRRTPTGEDDFRVWITKFGDTYESLRNELALIDPYFGTLAEVRQKLADVFENYSGRRSS